MSYQPDYIHLQNLIIRAVESIAENSSEIGNEKTTESYSTLIDFLETMYTNSVMAYVGAMLSGAKQSASADDTSQLLLGARELMKAAPESVNKKIASTYVQMIEGLNLPDAFQEKTFNEQQAERILEEAERAKATPPDSQ